MPRPRLLPRTVSEYDLRLLKVFRAVVECGGLTAAERVLNISRSTISIHLSNLEKRMNVRLAVRGRSGFALTEHGKTVYEASLKLFDSLNDFAWLVDSLDEEISGELSILCSDDVAMARALRLPEVIAWLYQHAPRLRIAINSHAIPEIESALLKGDAHLGIMPEFRNIDGLEYVPSYQDCYYLCCGSSHPLFDRDDTTITDDELASYPTAHPGIDVNLAGIQQLRKLNLTARAYQFDTRTALVLSGCYLGFFPISYIQGFLDRGEVRMIRPSERRYEVSHTIVHRRQRIMDPRLEMFFKAWKDVMKEDGK